MQEILIKVRHKADGLFHAVSPGLFGFRIVTETAEDMMKEAPIFAQTFFSKETELNVTHEWTADKIMFHFVIEADDVGYAGRCVERADASVWASDIPTLLKSIKLAGARIIDQEYLPAELYSARVIRPAKHIKVVLTAGATGNVATSPDVNLTRIEPFGKNVAKW